MSDHVGTGIAIAVLTSGLATALWVIRKRLRRPTDASKTPKYDAFISYSHRLEGNAGYLGRRRIW